MAAGDKPVKVFKHRGISASVFENSTEKDGKKQTFYRTSLRRTFKQGDEFISNANFSRDEVPIARLLLDRAWQWMLDAELAANDTTTSTGVSRSTSMSVTDDPAAAPLTGTTDGAPD